MKADAEGKHKEKRLPVSGLPYFVSEEVLIVQILQRHPTCQVGRESHRMMRKNNSTSISQLNSYSVACIRTHTLTY